MAQQNTPDTVEILSVGTIAHPHHPELTCLDVLFMLPRATFGRSVFRVRITKWEAGSYDFEHYANDEGQPLGTQTYIRALPDGYAWADWAAQMEQGMAALGTPMVSSEITKIAVHRDADNAHRDYAHVTLGGAHTIQRYLWVQVSSAQGGHAGESESAWVSGAWWSDSEGDQLALVDVSHLDALGVNWLEVLWAVDDVDDSVEERPAMQTVVREARAFEAYTNELGA